MSSIRDSVETFKTFWKGFKHYEETGGHLPDAYPAMRKLFVDSNGRFNDIFHYLYNLNKPYRPMPEGDSPFLKLNGQAEINEILASLDRDGYHILPARLDKSSIERLTDYSLKTPCNLQYDNEAIKKKLQYQSDGAEIDPSLSMGYIQSSEVLFDPDKLMATNYRLPESAVVGCDEVQRLLSDPGLVNLAQAYFKSQAMFTTISMWWTTSFQVDTPSSSLAQLYHFDMDRIKFLKFFCYLTDVSENDGPHCYVRGSCKRKPKALRRDGRFSDEEMSGSYSEQDIKEFTGPAGTIIIEDTRGFHKAKMPTGGNRLILEFELASCLFGPPYPRTSFEMTDPALCKQYMLNPNVFSNFDVKTRKSVKSRDAITV